MLWADCDSETVRGTGGTVTGEAGQSNKAGWLSCDVLANLISFPRRVVSFVSPISSHVEGYIKEIEMLEV